MVWAWKAFMGIVNILTWNEYNYYLNMQLFVHIRFQKTVKLTLKH